MVSRKFLLVAVVFISLITSVTAYDNAKKNTYANERFGISINCPKNWQIALRNNIIETRYGPEGILAKFRKSGSPYSPYITLTLISAMKMLRENWKPREMLEDYLENLRTRYKDRFNLVESPQETTVNDMPAAQAVYDITMGYGMKFREEVIYFRKNEFFIELIACAPGEEFDNYSGEFNYAINSLKLE